MLNQYKLIKHLKGLQYPLFKNLCVSVEKSHVAEHLEHRGLLKVAGKEANSYLQGLITNDINHLVDDHGKSMYAMFLNQQGRVLFDTIIYAMKDNETYLIECDAEALEPLQKHLKLFRVRRKIDVDVFSEMNVWVVFKPSVIQQSQSLKEHKQISNEPAKMSPVEDLFESVKKENLLIYRDPRMVELGYRILIPKLHDTSGVVSNSDKNGHVNYKYLRYSLGVPEGLNELPQGNCFPLEANCDYLHGVSFHKGCYIGQELTARIYHTGVIRKRYMPIIFHTVPNGELERDCPVSSPLASSQKIGKLRGVETDRGIALLKISKALEVPKLFINNVSCETFKPMWWPQELPKERVAASKE